MLALNYLNKTNVTLNEAEQRLVKNADKYVFDNDLMPWEAEKYYLETLKPLIERKTGNLTPKEINYFVYEGEEVDFGTPRYTVYRAFISKYMKARNAEGDETAWANALSPEEQRKLYYAADAIGVALK